MVQENNEIQENTENTLPEMPVVPADISEPPVEQAGEIEYGGEKFTIPEQFFDKDKKQLNLQALLKSQADLRRQVSQTGKTPEKYTFGELDEAGDALLIKALDGFGHSEKIGQEKMDGLVGLLKAASEEFRGNIEAETKAEFSRLFADKSETIAKDTQAWLNGLVGSKVSGDPDLKEFVDNIQSSPYGVYIIDAIRQAVKTKNVSAPTVNPSGGSGKKTEEELDAMVADPRYNKDPTYRKKVEEEFNRVYG